jgi:sortase A
LLGIGLQLLKKPLGRKRITGLFLGCGVFLFAAFCCSAFAADAQDVAQQAGLMKKLSLESFSPDQSEWSEKARANYQENKDGGGEPVAVLTIDRLNITAPAYRGTGRFTLDRGIGLVESGASPGEDGNIVLSGHRDGFFRPLKDIKLGDRITLHTLDGDQDFLVSELKIVDALDVSVLDDTGSAELTLITCHPFYYVGYAPDRYIVKAKPVADVTADMMTNSVLIAAEMANGGTLGGSDSTE